MTNTTEDTRTEQQRQDDVLRTLQRDFYAPFIRRTVPPKYLGLRLSSLQPSDKSRLPLDEQQKLYDELRAHPLDGWAFFAPAGYSKTVCSTALYCRAVYMNMIEWWNKMYAKNDYQAFEMPKNLGFYTGKPEPEIPRIYVWKKSVPDLLQQHFDMFNAGENSEVPKPDITAEKIQQGLDKGMKPRVFLEEIDKVKPSEFSINQIFRLFDVIDRNQCQLVIDTNLSRQQFTDVFGETLYGEGTRPT
jgi:hypothetical protein